MKFYSAAAFTFINANRVVRASLLCGAFVAVFATAGCSGAGAGAYVDPVQAAASQKAAEELAQYQGNFSATYEGSDQGSCQQITIFADGAMNGTCVSTFNPALTFSFKGQVLGDGTFSYTIGGGIGNGKFNGVDSASGTWRVENSSGAVTGTGTISLLRIVG